MNEQKVSKLKFVRNILITLIALGLVATIFAVAPDYILPNKNVGETLIINNKDVTTSQRLKNEVIVENNIIYLSESDISNFFDKYLYYDSKYDQYITTSQNKEATIKVGENKITINGISSDIKGKIMQRDDDVYFPISDMKDVYNIDIQNKQDTNIILIDSLDREQIQAETTKKTSVKIKAKKLSRTIEKVSPGDKFVLISTNDGWAKIRTNSGRIGYIKEKYITNKSYVREGEKVNNNKEKVSLVWDYYSEYATVPQRQGTTIPGINVISPSFFVLKKLGKGEIIDKADGGVGKEYVNWAKQNNYKVWPMVANDSMIETTSEILNDYNLRQEVIESILNYVDAYDLDGINIDFENMYKNDKDMFSRFIIELYPRLKSVNATLSVDVTAPDGGETWSQCFDRNVIADNSDYLVFMAYDQTPASSTKAGTTAGYNWVKTNLDKFLGQEGVAKEKLILGIPFYTRLWTEDASGKVKTETVNMKDVDTTIPVDVQKTWLSDVRQNYVEYTQDGNTKKMWIEDLKSIGEKLNLAKDYSVAGVAFWELDRQDDNVWNEVNKIIFNK